MKNKPKYTITCNKCKSKCELKIENDGACGDPDCCGCGAPTSYVIIECPKCGQIEQKVI